jgi:hypothetical protein
LSKRQPVALNLRIPVAEHIDQSDAIQRPQRPPLKKRPNRASTIRLLSLVVSDIAEAELVGGSGRPYLSPQSNSSAGAATAQTQGYDRPDESQMDAGCAWSTFATTMLTEPPE